MKNKFNIFLLIIISLFIVLGCENPSKNSNQPKPPGSALEVKLNFEIQGQDVKKPYVTGATSLPDGTDLLIAIKGQSVEYAAQQKTVVSSGGTKSELFSLNGSELAAGNYTVELTMPMAAVQNKAVQEVIGKEGENLTGSLVKKSDAGTTVETKKNFQIS